MQNENTLEIGDTGNDVFSLQIRLSNLGFSIEKIEIKPSQIDLNKEINKIGSYEAKINLHAEILAKIHIEVVKEKEKN